MTIHSYLLKNRMRSYDRQIGNAQRLERIRKYLAPLTEEIQGGERHGQDKRDRLIQQISREIMDNLLASGSTNPIVREIKEELDREFPERLFFSSNISDNELKIMRVTGNTTITLPPEDREKVMERVKEITREKVDRTIICPG
jgi:hypothetical protein